MMVVEDDVQIYDFFFTLMAKSYNDENKKVEHGELATTGTLIVVVQNIWMEKLKTSCHSKPIKEVVSHLVMERRGI